MPVSHADGERSLSQEELLERVARATRGFAGLGVTAGDAVALMLRNDVPFFEASLAAGNLGAYAVPINWHYLGDEAGYILRDSAAKAVVVHADLLAHVEGHVPEGVAVLVVPTPAGVRRAYGIAPQAGSVPERAADWDAWLAAQTPWTETPRTAPHSMIYTSGTTGRPKGVRRRPSSPEQLLRIGEVAARVFGIGPAMRTVVTGPLYHSAPNFHGLNAVRAGGTVLLQPRFDPEELLALIERHRITNLHMVPTMFVRLLKLPEAVRRRHDLSSLQFVVHAAAPCPPEVKEAMIAWWGPVVREYYGATETGAVVFCDSAEWLAHRGTVGRAVPGATVRIYDDAGRALPAGEIGEVFMRADFFPDFTYQGLDEKRREIERDGLVSVGDVGYLDADGFLHLCDRKRDMVISGGVNIYPAEVEAVLIGMPGVRDCAVFGIPDAEMGESLAAAIEPQPEARLTPEGVREWLHERIAGFKVPRHVEFHGALPREDSGKIFKRRLRDPHWQGAGRAI